MNPREKYLSLRDIEEKAAKNLPQPYLDFFRGGSGDEMTVRENSKSLDRWFLLPRVLTGTGVPNLSTSVLKENISFPSLISPTAFHKLAHEDGEIATAKAAAKAGTIMISSMAATTPIEEVVSAYSRINSNTKVWQQMYLQPDLEFNKYFVHRMVSAGCKAIVLTIDSPVFGHRERDLRNGFTDLPEGLYCPNMIGPENGKARSIEFNPNLNWNDVAEFIKQSPLPVLLKGILHPNDAHQAIEIGAKGIIVSNHGGRQLDTAVPATWLLPAIANSVRGRAPIIVDGGIRRGSDIIKCLALGANAVALGRPIVWGLAADGEEGIVETLNILRNEMERDLQLCGIKSVAQIDQNLIIEKGEFQCS